MWVNTLLTGVLGLIAIIVLTGMIINSAPFVATVIVLAFFVWVILSRKSRDGKTLDKPKDRED